MKLEDKIFHGLVYGLLGVLIIRARLRGRPDPGHTGLRALLGIGIPLALLDELHQAFIPGRFCDGFDALADLLGLLLAALFWRLSGEALSGLDRSIYCKLIKYDGLTP